MLRVNTKTKKKGTGQLQSLGIGVKEVEGGVSSDIKIPVKSISKDQPIGAGEGIVKPEAGKEIGVSGSTEEQIRIAKIREAQNAQVININPIQEKKEEIIEQKPEEVKKDLFQIDARTNAEKVNEAMAGTPKDDYTKSWEIAGSLVGGTGAGTAATKAKSALTALKIERENAAIKKIATQFNMKIADVEKIVGKKALAKTTDDLVKGTSALELSKLIKPVGAVMGADAIFTWWGLDNVISAHSIFLRDLVNDVKFGNIDPQKALEEAKKSQATREMAVDLVRMSAILNPILWPFRKYLLSGIEGDEEIRNFRMQQLEDLAATSQKQGIGTQSLS